MIRKKQLIRLADLNAENVSVAKLYHHTGYLIAPSFVYFIVDSDIYTSTMPKEGTVAYPRQNQLRYGATMLFYMDTAYFIT